MNVTNISWDKEKNHPIYELEDGTKYVPMTGDWAGYYKVLRSELTSEESFVFDEIKAYMQSDLDTDKSLIDLVKKASNVLNPSVPLVYEDAISKINFIRKQR